MDSCLFCKVSKAEPEHELDTVTLSVHSLEERKKRRRRGRERRSKGKGKEKRHFYSGVIMIIAVLERVCHFIWIHYSSVIFVLFGHKSC